MHWYGGSIAEAVTLSKQKNAIFVVFVEGDNDLSQEMSQTIDDSAVVSRLGNQDNFLAIKLKSGSSSYTHFAQIYQFVPVPSLFFIGRNGTPLEVVCAGVEANNLATRIDRILEEHYKEKPSHVQPSTSSQNIKEQTANLLQAEASTPAKLIQQTEGHQKPETSSGPAAKVPRLEPETEVKLEAGPAEEYEVVCAGDVCVRRPKSEQDTPSTSKETVPNNPIVNQPEPQLAAATESAASIEEKLEKAKELIEARRREKAEKEKELEKQKEIERRTAGKGVAELKKWQAEQEFKQIQEERKREKMENNLARQRILEQIAQDRAERRARDSAPAPPPPSHPPPPTSGDAGGAGGARIQFKLPDGTSHTAHFEADGTLGDVQRYIAQNLQLSASSFSLWTAFPRRELADPGATLRGLELAPSAALLVLPTRAPAAVAAPSAFTTLITFITQLFTSLVLEPSQQLYQWVCTRLSAPPAPRSPPPPRRAQPPPPPPPPSGPRRRGNIHRLPGDSAGDDDNNTWNGNSTQQM